MIQPGDRIPSVPVKVVTASGIADDLSDNVLGKGRVVFFAVPGAFTPTCSENHLPGFLDTVAEFAAAGVDRVVCGAVNDHHVVKAWAASRDGLGKIDFLADGNGQLAKATGLTRDFSASGMGLRFQRFAMILKDGVVEKLFVQTEPGVTTSGAPHVLAALAT
jgi:peroxiredoxin